MENIIGKTLVFTDIHCGLSGNKESRLKICVNVVKNIIKEVKQQHIQNILFLGDWFHERASINSNTINVAYKLVEALAKSCSRFILVLGNHDLYLKNSTDISSVNMFKNIKNVEIVSNVETLEINSKKAILVPWLGDVSTYDNEEFDFMFGHFEVSSKFLIKSYIEDNSRSSKISDDLSKAIDKDALLGSPDGYSSESSKLIGNFIDIAKRSGTIFSGHIHKHSEFISKGRKFIFVGSPYQQNLGDIGNECGFYVIDENCNYEFKEIRGIPQHVQLKVSDILEKGIDTFDFNVVKGNIVQKVYDVDISALDDTQISHKISFCQPYEELLPDYRVEIDYSRNASTKDTDNMVEAIKKSKLDYVKNYISQIDDAVIKENKIEKDKLFELMKAYYDKVS